MGEVYNGQCKRRQQLKRDEMEDLNAYDSIVGCEKGDLHMTF
jgi:hypothetical protein